MKKILRIFVLVSIALVLISCKGSGGGNSGSGSSSGSGSGTAPTIVASFSASLNVNYAIEVSTSTNTASARATLNGIELYNNSSSCSLSGNFDNGTLSFTGESPIAIANGSFNLNTIYGNQTLTKSSSTSNTATYSCTVPGSYVVYFYNTNYYEMDGRGYLTGVSGYFTGAGVSDSGVYSITSGDFTNGTIVIAGDTYTITNGNFVMTEEVQDVSGTTRNLTATFVKQ
ncbi:MAG: hypothetical protein II973_12410 [Spirochaetaceae bacterium]|nr:hypothetical protein [Spirochaetaceae bacterium]